MTERAYRKIADGLHEALGYAQGASEVARLRAALLAQQRPEGEKEEDVAAWLRGRGYTVTPPTSQ